MIYKHFEDVYRDNCEALLVAGQDVPVETWHAQDVREHASLVSREVTDVLFQWKIPPTQTDLEREVQPNMPWAEHHFAERVGGLPLNPPPSHVEWPWASSNAKHMEKNDRGELKFSHTYPERYWPKMAGHPEGCCGPTWGIRYKTGDLEDLVQLLIKYPLTRQAYLPVWFPEDTGAVAGQRVPCTLGYHFLLRDSALHVNYFMRSCDLFRYFRDDVYLTCRLTQWICQRLTAEEVPIWPGRLKMWISSLHVFAGDMSKLEKEVQ